MILSTEARVQSLDEHPIRVMTALIDDPVHAPGTVLNRGGVPLRLFAVVHDLEQEPSTCDAWIQRALDGVLGFCADNRVVALGLDPLGAVHGKYSAQAFYEMLEQRLEVVTAPVLRKVWLREASQSRSNV